MAEKDFGLRRLQTVELGDQFLLVLAVVDVTESGVVDVTDAVMVVVEPVDVPETQVHGPGLLVPVPGDVPLIGRHRGGDEGGRAGGQFGGHRKATPYQKSGRLYR